VDRGGPGDRRGGPPVDRGGPVYAFTWVLVGDLANSGYLDARDPRCLDALVVQVEHALARSLG
jgi:hypothetical protein